MTKAPEHELFPAVDGEDPPDVQAIHVTRFGARGQEWAPTLFAADEIPDLAALSEKFGGGRYELIARGENRSQITARRTYNLAGAPRPLGPVDAPAVPSVPHGAVPAGGEMMALIMSMGQQNMQMMVAMIQASSQQTAAMVQAIASVVGKGNQQQDPALLLKAIAEMGRGDRDLILQLMKNQGGGKSEVDTLIKGMEMGAEMAKDDGESLGETITAVAQAAAAAKAMAGAAP